MNIIIGEHYESDISVVETESGLLVKKEYRMDTPCIRWLNDYLKQFYDDPVIPPVICHEASVLKRLEPYGIVPKLHSITKTAIIMEFAGTPLSPDCGITRENYLWQSRNILYVLHKLGIKHNDMLDRKVIVKNGMVKLIDFTLAEYGPIKIGANIPNLDWARINQDCNILCFADMLPEQISGAALTALRDQYVNTAKSVYNYHNLGVGIYDDEQKEKTPHGYGERYNFDRMYMFVSNYDFTHKNLLDIGSNSGWFCFQSKMLGANKVLGVDYEYEGIMGQAITYAYLFNNFLQAGVNFLNCNLENVSFPFQLYNLGVEKFDVSFCLSVLHHIQNKKGLMKKLFDVTSDVIFYEDHEFWNELYDDKGQLIEVSGEGHRYNWNENMLWQHKMSSLDKHKALILKNYYGSWRRDVLLFDKFSKVEVIGLSEKRRPVLALWK